MRCISLLDLFSKESAGAHFAEKTKATLPSSCAELVQLSSRYGTVSLVNPGPIARYKTVKWLMRFMDQTMEYV